MEIEKHIFRYGWGWHSWWLLGLLLRLWLMLARRGAKLLREQPYEFHIEWGEWAIKKKIIRHSWIWLQWAICVLSLPVMYTIFIDSVPRLPSVWSIIVTLSLGACGFLGMRIVEDFMIESNNLQTNWQFAQDDTQSHVSQSPVDESTSLLGYWNAKEQLKNRQRDSLNSIAIIENIIIGSQDDRNERDSISKKRDRSDSDSSVASFQTAESSIQFTPTQLMIPLLPDDPFLRNSTPENADMPQDQALFSSSPIPLEHYNWFQKFILHPISSFFWLSVPVVLCWLTTIYYLTFALSMPYPTRWIGMQIFCVFAAGCCFMSFLVGMMIDVLHFVGAQFRCFRRLRDRILFRHNPEHAFFASDYRGTYRRHDFDWHTRPPSHCEEFIKYMTILGKSFLFACTLYVVFVSTQGAILFFPVPIPIQPFPDPMATPILDSVTIIFMVILCSLTVHTWVHQWTQAQSKRMWLLFVIFHLFFATGTFGFYISWRYVTTQQ